MTLKIKEFIINYWLHLVTLIAFSGVLGSLYYSEVEQIYPCQLCWYGRIFLYPMAIIGLIAIAKKEKSFEAYILALAIPGMFINGYQYLLQKTDLFESSTCELANPCDNIYVNFLGFITIPFMAFAAFSLITILAASSKILRKK
ncbi:MAG: disulfide bond formation protein B [Candidatus Dojkabacteria bacterium]|nr:disulfide bond formation protein B [Candidatus Dojkabacteria bacterium]MDQ7020291.1 disulfide bond formation protein B [Candidatus Dojkabacteria bacterium]